MVAALSPTFLRPFTVAAVLLLALTAAVAQGLRPSTASELRSRHAALLPQLEKNALRGPLHIESSEGQGEVYAVLDVPFATVSAALANPAHWCDVMMLHLNTKSCRSHGAGAAVQLELRIGRTYAQPLADAQRVLFDWRATVAPGDSLQVRLDAPDGPFDTRDYRILLEAVPLEGERTFLHMGSSFQSGTASRLALQLYLATLGRSKVGFSTLAARPGAQPEFVGGVRGLMERNTMRYFLAIEAYLGARSMPPASQPEARLQAWFDATEKYPRQLREIDRATYLEMKRAELRRQQAQ